MNIVSSSIQIETYLSSSWAACPFKNVPIVYANESTKAPSPAVAWVGSNILWGPAKLSDLNANVMVNTLSLTIYTQKGLGIVSSSLLADQLRSIIASASITDHRFEAPSGPVSVPNDGPWYQRNLSVSYELDVDN